ncbi:MAG TPA: L,D-transpeptidase [Coleofasciculaceae cyanobacterium]
MRWINPKWAVFLPILLPPLFAKAAQAVPVPSGLATNHPVVVNRSLEQLLQTQPVAIPQLPPLGNADAFLPKLDPMAFTHLVIRLSDRRVYVYNRDQVKTSFPVAIGRAGWETPTGSYHILQMLRNPAWQHPFTGEVIPPGADNPLGSRWIGFWTDGTNFIGFHGTPNAESVGRPASHGCIRMYDRDVTELFNMVKVGTRVDVVP